MQTFLPYPSFADSAAVLDSPRLGKQRVETLQILRALLVPTYGWQRHPAVGMWRGSTPALTAYGLAMTDAWTSRGFADSVRPQLIEFAPEVGGMDQDALARAGLLPPWLGDPAVHESHRSKLIAKDPTLYAGRFPGTPPDLDYVWPQPGEDPEPATTDPLWIVRVEDLDTWRDAGLLGMPLANPAGKVPPAWRAQLAHLEDDLEPGTEVGVIGADGGLLHLARVTGPLATVTMHEREFAARSAHYEGNLSRADLPVPAQLQNPRRVFPVHLAPVVRPAPGGVALTP